MIKRLFTLSSCLLLLAACSRQPPATSKTPATAGHAEDGCHDETCTEHPAAAASQQQLGATVCGNGLIEVFCGAEKAGRLPITIKRLQGTLAEPVVLSTAASQDAIRTPASQTADGTYTATLPVDAAAKTLWITAGQGEKAVQVDFPLIK